MLLSLILPYFELMAHSTTPFVILIALLVFYIVESRYGKKTVSELTQTRRLFPISGAFVEDELFLKWAI